MMQRKNEEKKEATAAYGAIHTFQIRNMVCGIHKAIDILFCVFQPLLLNETLDTGAVFFIKLPTQDKKIIHSK